jgi:hypothetical protein
VDLAAFGLHRAGLESHKNDFWRKPVAVDRDLRSGVSFRVGKIEPQ